MIKGDMIEVYKILTNKYNIDFNFEKYKEIRTRRHNLK